MSQASASQEVLERARRFVLGETDLNDLYVWVMDHMTEWGTDDNAGSRVANGILLACWELYDGYRDEDSVREAVSKDLSQIAARCPPTSA
jgi:hypothetical protein